MNERRTGNKSLVEDGHQSRDFGSLLTNSLTVFASLLTIVPFVAGVSTPAQTAAAALPVVPAAVSPLGAGMISPPVRYECDGRPCILEGESIKATVSGYTARVSVRQHFHNPNACKIDAQYTFPLSDRAAVDEMVMKIGDRTIKGEVRRRDQAQEMYQQARAAGYSAALLEQKRTNVFTQSVANVEPGKDIDITLNYTEMLSYVQGKFNLVFPTMVAPRFYPNGYVGDKVDANIALPSNISTDVAIDEGGVPIVAVSSPTHLMMNEQIDGCHATIHSDQMVPGKDIVLQWQVAGNELQTGCLAHKEGEEGFLSAMVIPPAKVARNAVAPREFVFIVDISGSQSGPPLEKAKGTMKYIIDRMNPDDTFQIIAFNNNVYKFVPQPCPATEATRGAAQRFLDGLQAEGGTVMGPAITAACDKVAPKNRLRIVTIMTDGFIGNDYQIMGMVKKLRGTSRWFSFGTGQSVNRTVIDGIAREGGGEPEYVLPDSRSEEIASEFYSRIEAPVLTDVRIQAEGLDISDVYPKRLSDVWEQRPLYFQARYHHGGRGTLVITGYKQGKHYTKRVHVVLPEKETANPSIEQLWARTRIEDLMSSDWASMQNPQARSAAIEEIIDLSLRHHVLSQFTAFLAIDSSIKPVRHEKKADAPVQTTTAKGPVPPMDPYYRQFSPNVVVLGAASIGVVVLARTRLAPIVITAGACVALAGTVFGFARGALQSTLSQSFSTVVDQLDSLNSYSSSSQGAGVGGNTYCQSANVQSSFAATTSCRPACTQAAPLIAGAPPTTAPHLASPTSGQLMVGTTVQTMAAAPTGSAPLPGGYYGAAAANLQGATNGSIGPQGADATLISGGNTAPKVTNPYCLRLCLPWLPPITVDLQLIALLLQWAWFAIAMLMVLPVFIVKNAACKLQRLAMGAAFLFICLNVPQTFEWLMQCARNANLV